MRVITISVLIALAMTATGQSCKGVPQFIRDLGYDISRSAIISGERRLLGAQLIEYKDIRNPGLGIARSHSDPYMGFRRFCWCHYP